MKRQIRIYLEPEDIKRLTDKATQSGFTGRGAVANYITKIAREPIAFLDENLRSVLGMIKIK